MYWCTKVTKAVIRLKEQFIQFNFVQMFINMSTDLSDLVVTSSFSKLLFELRTKKKTVHVCNLGWVGCIPYVVGWGGRWRDWVMWGRKMTLQQVVFTREPRAPGDNCRPLWIWDGRWEMRSREPETDERKVKERRKLKTRRGDVTETQKSCADWHQVL